MKGTIVHLQPYQHAQDSHETEVMYFVVLLHVFLLLVVTIKNACLTFPINHYSPCTMGHKELNQNG